jgi:hypothetical protein
MARGVSTLLENQRLEIDGNLQGGDATATTSLINSDSWLRGRSTRSFSAGTWKPEKLQVHGSPRVEPSVQSGISVGDHLGRDHRQRG